MRFGAIDIGSNSVRLLVADLGDGQPWNGELVTVARAGEACRLGRGLRETGLIEPELIERAAAVSEEFARRARALGASHLVIAATAALRNATNGPDAASAISSRAGAPVRILSGEEEARICYRAVSLGMQAQVRDSQCVVFDLGGGSTEVVSGVGNRVGRWISLPFGAVTITEAYLRPDPTDSGALEVARQAIEAEIMHGCAYLPARSAMLAGVGGTVTVLASLDRGLAQYEPSQIEGAFIPNDRLALRLRSLLEATPDQRRAMPVMGEGRADIIGAGALIVEALVKRFGAPGLLCSTQGLRYGLVRLAAEEFVGPAR